jgi:hypothetical protein
MLPTQPSVPTPGTTPDEGAMMKAIVRVTCSPWFASLTIAFAALLCPLNSDELYGQEASDSVTQVDLDAFDRNIASTFREYCERCHNENDREAGVRVDLLDAEFDDGSMKLWEAIEKQIASGAMPPEDEPHPSDEHRAKLLEEIAKGLDRGRSRQVEWNGSVRRLTIAQYGNALQDLLGIRENVTKILPPDASSKDGFTNNAQTLSLSPLLVEAFFQIADQALRIAMVEEKTPPTIQHFQMNLGQGVNLKPHPDPLILGANNLLLRNEDFVVIEPPLVKPFPFQPFAMRRSFRFIEGYQGNDTVREWREFQGIEHAVFACMRGSEEYPKGRPFESVPSGLLLRPAIPSSEIFGESNTYGPHANFKISLRELPDHGRFRVKVRAAKYEDGLLLDPRYPTLPSDAPFHHEITHGFTEVQSVAIQEPGIYQIDVLLLDDATEVNEFQLHLGDRQFSGALKQIPFLAVRLAAGALSVRAESTSITPVQRIVLRKVDNAHPLAQQFRAFESRCPELGVHLGLRRDCGSTMNPVGMPKRVTSTLAQDYLFEDAIANYPSPDVEPNNVNYLAGIREIGVRSEFTDGRDIPRLRVERIEFEGPFYETWPPASHHNLFESQIDPSQHEAYARDVIVRFATQAFRRPLASEEQNALVSFWSNAFRETEDIRESIRRTMTIVLTSPQFLFLVETSQSAEPEDLDSWELASKIAFFLWNAPPDSRLRTLASENRIRAELHREVDRLIDDPRFEQFCNEFVSQWLGLDKIEMVETDSQRFPNLTRDTKTELQKEPVRFVEHAIRNNWPVHALVRSDTMVVNDVVANYYGFGDRVESGLAFVAIPSPKPGAGGILTQAAILAGLSDGRESNPVKRGAWFARRMVAMPPEDPPPNVPKLEDLTHLTLRERLESHRNVKGCIQCHNGIDPWGLPFEAFDAGGLRISGHVDSHSVLPTGGETADFDAFQEHVATTLLHQVAFSIAKHLTAYAIGRSLTYNETHRMRDEIQKRDAQELRLRDLLHAVVESDLFLKK